jgi:GDP-mannose 6-dehydrogenase
LAFKENTDDLRESPVVALLEHLIGKGRQVRVYDPHIRLEEIYGSNQRFVLSAIPHIANLFESKSGAYARMGRPPRRHAAAYAAAAAALIQRRGLPMLDLCGADHRLSWSAF